MWIFSLIKFLIIYITAAFFVIVIVIGIGFGGYVQGVEDTMKQAYKRGHAVQCLGKTGYHWECEEN